jgi:acetyl esterase/lipase
MHTAQLMQSTRLWLRKSSAETQPDQVREYHGLPNNRVFMPKEKPAGPLPLVINVHGGGFCVSNPSEDDALCRYLADTCQCIVISVNYRKAPKYAYPIPLNDIKEIIPRVINDDSLPINEQRVVLCGSSAGGNLVLSAGQTLQTTLEHPPVAIIALYPLTDMVTSTQARLDTRPDTSISDPLASMMGLIVRCYVQHDEDLTDPSISPCFVKNRSTLPSHAYIIGCQQDLLHEEARCMAEFLAGDGNRTPTSSGWRTNDVVWESIRGQAHAFNNNKPLRSSRAQEEERLSQTEQLHKRLAEWLREDIFA